MKKQQYSQWHIRSKYDPKKKNFTLKKCHIIDVHYLRALANGELPLKAIDISENKLKADDFISWEEVEWKSLLTLFLNHNPIRQRGAYSIFRSFMPLLTELELKNCEIRAAGMKYLVAAELKALRKLAVGFNRFNEEGVVHLASSNWPNLEELSLNGCHIQSQGLRRLLKGNWPKLHTLTLDENRLNLEGLLFLCLAPWNNLHSIGINFNLSNPHDQQTAAILIRQSYPRVSLLKARRFV